MFYACAPNLPRAYDQDVSPIRTGQSPSLWFVRHAL